MIRFIREGDDLKNGLNVYHPSLYKTSIGFKLRWNNTCWMFRWNKSTNKFYKIKITLTEDIQRHNEIFGGN